VKSSLGTDGTEELEKVCGDLRRAHGPVEKPLPKRAQSETAIISSPAQQDAPQRPPGTWAWQLEALVRVVWTVSVVLVPLAVVCLVVVHYEKNYRRVVALGLQAGSQLGESQTPGVTSQPQSEHSAPPGSGQLGTGPWSPEVVNALARGVPFAVRDRSARESALARGDMHTGPS